MRFPSQRSSADQILAEIERAQQADVDWRHGKVWSYVYFADGDLLALLERAYVAGLELNGMAAAAFPSLSRMEHEVLGMTADLLHAPNVAGSMTSGGSESIFLAVKSAREWARETKPHIHHPEIIVPYSAHPAFNKAGSYLDVRIVRVPVEESQRADVRAISERVNRNTIMIVGSAPSYPCGIIDPIAELAGVAAGAGLLFHVDACLGGFVLPFARTLGTNVPPFDFLVPGVTSMSADLHKYGYTAKGASVVLYRDNDLFRHQLFEFEDWNCGRYVVPNVTGTRPGGAITAAWAALQYLGEPGYRNLTARSLDATRRLLQGIRGIAGLRVLGDPQVNVFAFGSEVVPVQNIAAGMLDRGWILTGLLNPPSLHLTVTASHDAVVEGFLSDLREVVKAADLEATAWPDAYGYS